MILVIGEILFDLFPSYRCIGGAPFNFAFHLKHLGFDVCFISRVGKDDLGKEIRSFLKSHGFKPSDLQEDEIHPTGTVEVTMDKDGSHSFSIVPNTAYDKIEFDEHLEMLAEAGPDLFYFGTLIQRTSGGQDLIKTILDHLPHNTLKFCDINLRPKCYTRQVIEQSMTRSDILKLSHEELNVLVPDNTFSLQERALRLMGPPGPDRIILTRGKDPSIWVSAQGTLDPQDPSSRPLTLADTVGAGDAYAAMAAAARLSNIPDPQAMDLAQDFAARICEIKGALPLDPDFYTKFLSRLSHDR